MTSIQSIHDVSAPELAILPRMQLDKAVLTELREWAEPMGLTLEQAVQIAVCLFNLHRSEWVGPAPARTPPRVPSRRMRKRR